MDISTEKIQKQKGTTWIYKYVDIFKNNLEKWISKVERKYPALIDRVGSENNHKVNHYD